MSNLLKSLNESTDSNAKIESDIQLNKQKFDDLTNQLGLVELKNSLDSLQIHLSDKEKEIQDLNAQIDSFKQIDLNTLLELNEELKSKNLILTNHIESAEESIAQLNDKINQLNSQTKASDSITSNYFL